MALSLLVVGGVGAGVSVPEDEQIIIEDCQEAVAPNVAVYRQVDLGTIVVVGNANAVSDDA